MLELSLLLLAAQAATPERAAEASPAPPIVVNGLPERVDGRRVEQPYTEGEHLVLGSRIPRRRDERQFRTVASNTGLAGLIPGKDTNFDATGGQTPRFAGRPVTECVAGHPQVPERTACILFRVRQAIDRDELEAAAEAIVPLLRSGTLSGIERYYAGTVNLELADAAGDPVRREAAVTMMVESGRMPAADRAVAMRMLAQLAARRGDDGAALARLERVVAEMPDEPRNHADLAFSYARGGRNPEAVERMTRAVALARHRGAAVPQAWTDFLSRNP